MPSKTLEHWKGRKITSSSFHVIKKRETFITFISTVVSLSKTTCPKNRTDASLLVLLQERIKVSHLRDLYYVIWYIEFNKSNPKESIRSKKK